MPYTERGVVVCMVAWVTPPVLAAAFTQRSAVRDVDPYATAPVQHAPRDPHVSHPSTSPPHSTPPLSTPPPQERLKHPHFRRLIIHSHTPSLQTHPTPPSSPSLSLSIHIHPPTPSPPRRASDTPARARPAAESAPAAPAPEADDTGMIDIALLGISKPEISMLRALRTPSPAVIPVFEAVSLLLGQSPVMVPVRNATPKGKTHAPDWWKTALSMMHDVNRFLNRLQDVADRCILHNDADKLSIAPEALHRVGVLLERGALEPEVGGLGGGGRVWGGWSVCRSA